MVRKCSFYYFDQANKLLVSDFDKLALTMLEAHVLLSNTEWIVISPRFCYKSISILYLYITSSLLHTTILTLER